MIINADAIQWAKEYQGEPFHALICDPPYHLTTITKRFGKEGSVPAQEGTDGAFKRLSTGFMGKKWDGGDVAFQPKTWQAFYNILFPGAFGMAFGGSRTAHRMAVAIEDAGFIIHPQMSWVYGSGFPKATRIKDNEVFEGYRYGLQALKPASEPIIVFQRSYDGRPLENIVETGAGALNINGGRIGTEEKLDGGSSEGERKNSITGDKRKGAALGMFAPGAKRNENWIQPQGRWPANFILTHLPECQMIEMRESDSYQINRFTDGAKPFGDGAGHEFESEEVQGGQVPVWECIDGCPVKALDKQTGTLTSGTGAVKKASSAGHQGSVYGAESRPEGTPNVEDGDSGGASRFFHQSHWAIENIDPFVYQAKVSVSERNAGLGTFRLQEAGIKNDSGRGFSEIDPMKKILYRNPHPTLKPIALIEHLATLLLPPKEYSPRRIIVPFAGVASEMIGCWRAGWEKIVGIELLEEYSEIGKARLDYWKKQGVQLDFFNG